jgi:NAD(P)H dehydrogenase (quinone)
MSLVITGATGHLGRLVVEQLLEAGVPPDEIVATGRATEKIKDLAERGVRVRAVDYGDPAADHQATERLLRDSGVPSVLLRNGWYYENYTGQLPAFLAQGAIPGSAGDGQLSAASRADYAAAAVRVLTTDGHAGRAYELGGDEPFTLAQLAAEISAQSGQTVRYADLPEAEFARALAAHGVPQVMADDLAEVNTAVADGALYTASGDLSRLIGRPATTLLSAAVGAGLSALNGA